MSKRKMKVLAGVSLALLALAWAVPESRAESASRKVILESKSSPIDQVFWVGPALIWIDGVKYEGTLLYSGDGRMNKNSWHGTETHVYDFPALGTLELSGTAKTQFSYVAPDHRWHYYTSRLQITGGTGAFSEAHGVFRFGGNTEWHIPPPPAPYAFAGGKGTIVGIQLD